MRTDILREDEPLLRMFLVLPRRKVTQVIAVQSHEVLGVQQIRLGDRREGNRLRVSGVLLKNLRTHAPVVYLEP